MSLSACTALALLALLAARCESAVPIANFERSPCRPGERCVLIGECRRAYNELTNGARPPVCGFRGFEPRVCCKEQPTAIEIPESRPRNNKRQTSPQTPPNNNNNNNKNNNNESSPLVDSPSVRACQRYRQQFDGDNKLVFKVYRGMPTGDKELLFMAALGYSVVGSTDLRWECGGNLISDRFVLTAAHCVTDARKKGFTLVAIRLGERNIRSKARKSTDYGVEPTSITLHPRHRPNLRYNDIALIRTDRTVVFSDLVRPACLPPNSVTVPSAGTRVVAAGWGAIDQAGTRSEDLLKVALDVISTEECKRRIPTGTGRGLPQGISGDMICAADAHRGAITCVGDSGGPLLEACGEDQTCTVLGLTSFGNKTCGGSTPGVYTRVSSFVTWIESVVWP